MPDMHGRLGDAGQNQAWYESLFAACSEAGFTLGVYSSHSQWSSIFGSASYCCERCLLYCLLRVRVTPSL